MKLKTVLLLFLIVLFNQVIGQNNSSSIERAKALLSKMTLEEKVGQMTQLTIEMISKGVGNDISKPHAVDTAKLRNVIVNLGVGSILNVSGYTYTVNHWKEVINSIEKYSLHFYPCAC